jgi:hypothetical protein
MLSSHLAKAFSDLVVEVLESWCVVFFLVKFLFDPSSYLNVFVAIAVVQCTIMTDLFAHSILLTVPVDSVLEQSLIENLKTKARSSEAALTLLIFHIRFVSSFINVQVPVLYFAWAV